MALGPGNLLSHRSSGNGRRLDVDHVADHRALPRAVDAVDIQSDDRLDAEVVGGAADTANAEVRRSRGLAAADDEARHVLLEVPDVLDACLLDLRAGESADSNRDIEDILGTFRREDDEVRPSPSSAQRSGAEAYLRYVEDARLREVPQIQVHTLVQ